MRDLFRDEGNMVSVSYTYLVDRHLKASSSFPSLAEADLPNLSILSRWSGLRYLGVESCSVELCLLVAKHLMLPQTSPRFTKKYHHASPDRAPKSMGWPEQHERSNRRS